MTHAAADRSERAAMLSRLKHPDPVDVRIATPDGASVTPRWKAAFRSHEMGIFKEVLGVQRSVSLRDAVLDDVESFFDAARGTQLKREEFEKGRAWALNLLWYAFLQTEGYYYPISVAIARALPPRTGDATHLDFGSGAGVTSQLFHRLGYTTVLADAEPMLLEFARFRLLRRGQPASYVNLLEEPVGEGGYAVITAIDTLPFVPDLDATMVQLHRALRPGGILFANFPQVTNGGWTLRHHDGLALARRLGRVGFEPVESLDGRITMYLKVNPNTFIHTLRGVRDSVVLNATLRRFYHKLRRVVAR
jgi:2-polyprenyl-3-methyl-5-hydroxy-6-metoxy-1,4-benzoquinol methylase